MVLEASLFLEMRWAKTGRDKCTDVCLANDLTACSCCLRAVQMDAGGD